MATLTGTNLLDSIVESTGADVNDLVRATLAARLQQMIDNGTFSNLAASVAISGFSSTINDATEINELSDIVEENAALIEAGPVEVTITNGSVVDADEGAFQFNAALAATDIFSANIANFTGDDAINIDDAFNNPANLLFATTGATEINFAFGDMTDYTPSFTLNLSDIDAALVTAVEGAANTVAVLGILDAAWGTDWLI